LVLEEQEVQVFLEVGPQEIHHLLDQRLLRVVEVELDMTE
jgi:hypothetical protein